MAAQKTMLKDKMKRGVKGVFSFVVVSPTPAQ
jgi:hypothetical protein